MRLRVIDLIIITLVLVFIDSCAGWGDKVDRLLLSVTNQQLKILKYDKFVVQIKATTMRNYSLDVQIKVEAKDKIIYFSDRLIILRGSLPLECRFSKNFKSVKHGQFDLDNETQTFDYSIFAGNSLYNFEPLEIGEKIKVFGTQLIEYDGRYYDLDPLVFYVAKSY